MVDQQNTAELGKPRGRWYQFRLRTLVIGVVLLGVACAYVGSDAKAVWDRKAMLETGGDSPVIEFRFDDERDRAIPLLRRWMGDHFCRGILVKQGADIKRVRMVFPESDILAPPPTPPVAASLAPPQPPPPPSRDLSEDRLRVGLPVEK
jgi:hypothetical protein